MLCSPSKLYISCSSDSFKLISIYHVPMIYHQHLAWCLAQRRIAEGGSSQGSRKTYTSQVIVTQVKHSVRGVWTLGAQKRMSRVGGDRRVFEQGFEWHTEFCQVRRIGGLPGQKGFYQHM